MTLLARTAAASALLLTAACASDSHLIRDFGASNDLSFAAQRGARAAPARAVTGLDPQEASIIADAYRASLVPDGRVVKEEPLILVAPPTRDAAPGRPAPSVPRY